MHGDGRVMLWKCFSLAREAKVIRETCEGAKCIAVLKDDLLEAARDLAMSGGSPTTLNILPKVQ